MKPFGGGSMPTAIVAAVAIIAASGGYALASGGSNTITACVKHGTKVLYIGKCEKQDAELTWNKTGPQGPAGATGPQAVPGPPVGPLPHA